MTQAGARPPALSREAAIAEEAAARFDTRDIVIEHRTGFLSLGEASVAIAVAHARRAPAIG